MLSRTSCPACDSPRQVVIYERLYSDPALLNFIQSYYRHATPESIRRCTENGSFAIVDCPACGLLYQRDVPDADALEEIYERWLIEDDHLKPDAPPQPAAEYHYLASEVMHLLAEQRRLAAGDRRIAVLDFGAGWCNWLMMARAFGARVFGSELSASKLEYARSVGIPMLTLEQIGRMKFDLIATEQVFEHLVAPSPILRALVSALEDTGFLKISVPNGRRVRAMLKTWTWQDADQRRAELMPIHPLEHLNCFTRSSLDAFASRHGLQPAATSAFRAVRHSAAWSSPRACAKNLLRPLWRFSLRNGTYAVYGLRKRSN